MMQKAQSQADIDFQLARVWHRKGDPERAILGYQKVLDLQTSHLPTYLALSKLLIEQGRFSEVVSLCQAALQHYPNESELHKNLVNACCAQGKIDEAWRYYQLTRLGTRAIHIQESAILCCTVVRNESLRLPYFLSYYRQKGVTHFFVVDNLSTDQTVSYLLEQPDVYLWQSDLSFNQANFGSAWFELLLRQYAINHWCLTVDADELLYYPDCESKPLAQFCRDLEQQNQRAYSAVLLDMYSNRAIAETQYTAGTDFLDSCPYFDRMFYHREFAKAGPYKNQTFYFGGVRERIFGANGQYLLSKIPLLKYHLNVILAGGQHWTNLPEDKIAAGRGCLLHFKYFSSFHHYIQQEVNRQEHYGGALQYVEYAKGIATNRALTLYDAAHSVKFKNSQQLVELGIMQLNEPAGSAPIPEFPQILSLPATVHRPLWSVMITSYKRTDYLKQALSSVLQQDPGPEQMQIEVINDSGPASVQTEILALVESIAPGRVSVYCTSENIGHPEIFNLCIERTCGQWIHILHDDDWVKPGFYRALETGIAAAPEIGAAFCRHVYVNPQNQPRIVSVLERETPGVIADWLERIAVMCRLQFPSMVVKREVYEHLGGFYAPAGSAFDWEMWKRIATKYPVWYESQPLACFREHESSESSELIRSGQQIEHTRQAIQISQSYLPAAVAARLSATANENYAIYALNLAKQFLQQGDAAAALNNLRQALRCSQSPQVQHSLVSLLLHGKESSE